VTSGEFRPVLHPRFASWVLYGALEEVLTGWTLSRPPETPEDVAAAVDTVVTVLCDGLVSPL
jgi:hypothetical protein